MTRRVALISRDNGAGLSTDMELLDALLTDAGHEVTRVDWQTPTIDRHDVGIFLELLQPRLFPYLGATVGVFNIEWFLGGWRKYLRGMTQLWAKSDDAMTAYGRLGVRRRSRLTGFASRDLYDPTVTRQDRCFHLKGHSDLKNTDAVIEAWRRHGSELPELVVVSNDPVPGLPTSVTQLSRVCNDELRQLMNECRVHVCPSRAEGWGHYITEGLSTGASVVTVEASPMNEHVKPEWGFLVKPTNATRRGLTFEYSVDPDAIADAVQRAVALTPGEREERAAKARQHVLTRNDDFRRTALRLIGEM